MLGRKIALLFALGLLVSGCGDAGQTECSAGQAGCMCVVGSCDAGLNCIGDICYPEADGDGDGTADGDGDTGDGDGDTGDGDGDGETECTIFLECVSAVSPATLSSMTQLYGPEGECFEIAGLTEEDCWAECKALREQLAEENPDAEECGPIGCNDGVLSPTEICDSTPECTAQCNFGESQGPCNPVNNAGCSGGLTCHFAPGPFSLYCTESGSVGAGGACEFGDECAAEAPVCFPADNDACDWAPECFGVCYLGESQIDYGCPNGMVCTPIVELGTACWGDVWPSMFEPFGYCQ